MSHKRSIKFIHLNIYANYFFLDKFSLHLRSSTHTVGKHNENFISKHTSFEKFLGSLTEAS